MRIRTIVMLISALVLSGCAPAMAVSKVGRRFPPNPADCSIKWENLELHEAMTRYEHVGVIGIGIRGEEDIDTSPELKERVRVEACRLGADAALVGMNSSVNTIMGTHRGISVTLLRKRDSNSPPLPALPPGMTAPSTAALPRQ